MSNAFYPLGNSSLGDLIMPEKTKHLHSQSSGGQFYSRFYHPKINRNKVLKDTDLRLTD